MTVALTAIGADPANVAGYNLLKPLGDFDKTIWQGINGPIWALIALGGAGILAYIVCALIIPEEPSGYIDAF